MAEKYGESRSKQSDAQSQRRVAILDYDELMLLRSIHSKLDACSELARERPFARMGGLIW
jgi:hypothetical protein